MPRRALTVLSAASAATAALVMTATPASAATFCNTTTGGALNGTTICVTTNSIIANWAVPYSVGSICVSGICTQPVSGTLNVPVPQGDAVVVHGQICATYKATTLCVPYTTELPPIATT